MRTLKEEEVNGKTYASIDEARTHIGAFLETVYNRGRLGFPPSATNPRSSSKPNSANPKPSERTQTKALSLKSSVSAEGGSSLLQSPSLTPARERATSRPVGSAALRTLSQRYSDATQRYSDATAITFFRPINALATLTLHIEVLAGASP